MSGIAIIGGGPAGAAAAIALARQGARPILFERETAAAEKVCGEFLSEGAGRALGALLGVGPAELGAVPITRARFGAGRREAAMPLPFAAWSLPRAVLDEALLRAAQRAGAELRRGAGVRGAARSGAGWRLRLECGAAVEARELILATGKHELRGFRRVPGGGAVGLKLPLLSAAPAGEVVLLACGGGYAGLQPRPGGGANLCAALDPAAAGVPDAARSAGALLDHVRRGSALAARLLAGAAPALPRPMAVAGIPYGFLHRGAGPFRIGDQAAVLPSLCGDGVAMALWSGIMAAERLGAGPAAVHARWAAAAGGGMRLAGLLAALLRRAPALMALGMAVAPAASGRVARRARLGWAPQDAALRDGAARGR